MISEVLLPKKKKIYSSMHYLFKSKHKKRDCKQMQKKKKKSFCIKYVKAEPKFSGVNPDRGLNSPLAHL